MSHFPANEALRVRLVEAARRCARRASELAQETTAKGLRRAQGHLGAERRALRDLLVPMTDEVVRAWRAWSADERGDVQRELERVAEAIVVERRRGPGFRAVDARATAPDHYRRGR